MQIVPFLDIAFHRMSFQDALQAITNRASERRGFAYVATPNVDHVVSLAADPGRAALYQGAWLRLNDSRVLTRLARLSRIDLPPVPGADLAAALALRVIDKNEPVTVIGGDEAMIAGLKVRFGWTDVRWHAPPMALMRNPRAVADAARFIAAQQSRFTFICVGAPQQELIAHAVCLRGDAVGVGLCVGAALEFLSGVQHRAPRPVRRWGLEWAWRLAGNPGRLARRYLVKGPRVFSLWLRWLEAQEAAVTFKPGSPVQPLSSR
jgi:exopolysaccharide biosynthesis WecB/TagA/CpsF family protein